MIADYKTIKVKPLGGVKSILIAFFPRLRAIHKLRWLSKNLIKKITLVVLGTLTILMIPHQR